MPSTTEYLKPYEEWLTVQAAYVQPFEDYYAGRHKMAFSTAKYRQTFGALFEALAVNWCESAVDASVDRLKVEGFRFGVDQSADTEAWDRIWQPNDLDAKSLMVHTEAGKAGRAYALVEPGKDGPRVTVEHPCQMVVAHAPGDRSTRTWAFKRWLGDDDYFYATLYLPDRIEKFRSEGKREVAMGSAVATTWIERPNDPGGPHNLGVVPVVPFYNKPDILTDGNSDLASAIPIQDAINKEVADMLIASEFAAFPQRVVMGLEVPTDEDGTPTPAAELKAAVSRFWVLEDKDAKIGEFKAADLNNYVVAITSLLQQFAAITRTPPHYLLGQVVNASGDALKAAEAGLTSKVARKQIDFSDSWEEVLRLGFRVLGKAQRAEATNAETIWANPEKRSEAELVDAAVKLRSIGVPLEACWERIGATQTEIARWKKLAGLPERPPPGATTSEVPPVLGGADTSTPS